MYSAEVSLYNGLNPLLSSEVVLMLVMNALKQEATAFQHKGSIVYPSNTEVIFVLSTTPLKYAFPINRFCFHKRLALIYLRRALKILPTSEMLVLFLFTYNRHLSFLWEAVSSVTAVGDFLYFHTKLY
jgi:hypothetical protein